jgi:hypothetical protein
MRVDKTFPTWAVFACQVFVDTRRELDPQLGKGFEDFSKQGGWLLQFWTSCLNTGKEYAINNFHKTHDGMVGHQINSLRVVVQSDFVRTLVDKCFAEHPGMNAHYN